MSDTPTPIVDATARLSGLRNGQPYNFAIKDLADYLTQQLAGQDSNVKDEITAEFTDRLDNLHQSITTLISTLWNNMAATIAPKPIKVIEPQLGVPVILDFAEASIFYVGLRGDATFGVPLNMVEGQVVLVYVQQDGLGDGRVLFPTNAWRLAPGEELSHQPFAEDRLVGVVRRINDNLVVDVTLVAA